MALSVVCLTGFIASAHPNPQYRVCNDYGADFVVADIPFDQIGLCKTGFSFVGAIDLMNFYWENKVPQSIQNYIDGRTDCPSKTEFLSFPLEGGVQTLCVFDDGSVMDSVSIQTGRYDFSNSALNQLLNL